MEQLTVHHRVALLLDLMDYKEKHPKSNVRFIGWSARKKKVM